MLRALRTFLLLLLINNYLLASSEYGWVQDIVGIDESRFNYEDGSDADLELYLKNSFFSSVKLSFIVCIFLYKLTNCLTGNY